MEQVAENNDAENPEFGLTSTGSKLDRMIEAISGYNGTKPKDKSFADKDYTNVELTDGGKIAHPYDVSCPYCHNLSTTDKLAIRGKIRTEQSMHSFED
jgi:hypothetical protein